MELQPLLRFVGQTNATAIELNLCSTPSKVIPSLLLKFLTETWDTGPE